MKITQLGQAGLLMEKGDWRIMIDPYLSDSVEKITPAFYRRVAVREEIFSIKPDMMIFTHNHLDHYDPETVERLRTSAPPKRNFIFEKTEFYFQKERTNERICNQRS